MISSAQTVANTGRFIKKSTNIQTRTSGVGLGASVFKAETADLLCLAADSPTLRYQLDADGP
jgi:hypothetical protein